MTPKDKSENLVNNYRVMLMQTDTDAGQEILCTSIAKECALIAVDEIINNVLVGIDLPSTWGNYWKQVKQEIENL